MAKYIDREAVVAEFHRLGLGENSILEKIFADGVYAVLETFPAADVEPVRHGMWVLTRTSFCQAQYECSKCGKVDQRRPNYCPNCGAKMYEEVGE